MSQIKVLSLSEEERQGVERITDSRESFRSPTSLIFIYCLLWGGEWGIWEM